MGEANCAETCSEDINFVDNLEIATCQAYHAQGQCSLAYVKTNCAVTCAGCTAPTMSPTTSPTAAPSTAPTKAPSVSPSVTPTSMPTHAPTSCLDRFAADPDFRDTLNYATCRAYHAQGQCSLAYVKTNCA